ILHVDPEPPSRRRPGVNPRLEAVCLKAMAKDPAARFATMKEFAAALDAALQPAPASSSISPTTDSRQPEKHRRRPPRWGFVVVGLVLVGGLAALAGIVFFIQSDTVRATVELRDVDLSDKSLRFFLDEEPISAGALAQPIELKPGDYLLVVKRGKDIVRRKLL